MECSDSTAHAVLSALSIKARGTSLVAKIDAEGLAKMTGEATDSVRYALDDLLADGFIREAVTDSRDAFRLCKGKHICPCDLRPKGAAEYTGGAGVRSRGSLPLSPLLSASGGMEGSASNRIAAELASEEPLPDDEPEGTSGERIDSVPVSRWNYKDMARYFERRVLRAAHRLDVNLGPTPFNERALMGSFRQWRDIDSLTKAEIKEMVDIFARSLDGRVRRGSPAWRTFLAQRTGLHNDMLDARKLAAQKSMTAEDWITNEETAGNRYDRDYWMGTA